jgi:hypothetical protein
MRETSWFPAGKSCARVAVLPESGQAFRYQEFVANGPLAGKRIFSNSLPCKILAKIYNR